MADPRISYIDPSTVKRNTAATQRVLGSNFNADSYLIVDNANPKYRYVSSTELEASLTTKDTEVAGKRGVKVHNLDGTLSNVVTLTVT